MTNLYMNTSLPIFQKSISSQKLNHFHTTILIMPLKKIKKLIIILDYN